MLWIINTILFAFILLLAWYYDHERNKGQHDSSKYTSKDGK